MQKFRVTILGPPKPLERARATIMRSKGKEWVRFYDTKANQLNKDLVQRAVMAAKAQAGLSGVIEGQAFELTVLYHLYKPESKRRKNSNPFPFPTGKPDLSNLVKLFEDAANQLIWKDDAQICNLRCYKRYTLEEPRTEVWIRVMSADECGNPFENKAGQQAEIET